MKKGKRAGTTEFAHNANPFLVADRFCLENRTKQTVKTTNRLGNMFLFNDKKMK
ncbi:MAG: hypothetical protein HFJ57_03560 [Clostridia bacterium]|nr:hypothetical protein [Clostridia bacterium]